MNKTREEILKSKGQPWSCNTGDHSSEYVVTYEDALAAMKEYGKQEVKNALEAAYENGEIDFEEYGGGIEGGSINEKSILKAYKVKK